MRKTMMIASGLFLLVGFVPQAIAQKKEKPARADIAYEEYMAQFTKEEHEALAFLREISPEKAEKLAMLKAVNDKEYVYQLKKVIEEMMQARKLEKANPERYERMLRTKTLEEKSHVLGRACRDASGAEKSNIEVELKAVLGELFDLREEERREEVAKLEARLNELKESLQVRQKNKDEIIKKRLAKLTGQNQYLEWE